MREMRRQNLSFAPRASSDARSRSSAADLQMRELRALPGARRGSDRRRRAIEGAALSDATDAEIAERAGLDPVRAEGCRDRSVGQGASRREPRKGEGENRAAEGAPRGARSRAFGVQSQA